MITAEGITGKSAQLCFIKEDKIVKRFSLL